MTRQRFAGQLAALNDATVMLGEQASTAVSQALHAFTACDIALASRVVEEDPGINRMERQVLDDAALLLTLQAPVASDLRRVLGVSRVAYDLERIGDHARDIARATLRLATAPDVGSRGDLSVLIEQTQTLVSKGLRCFAESDVEQARALSKLDDTVDRAYSALFGDLLGLMVEDPSTVARATYTLFVAHDIERIADRMTNVMETVVYIVTGETVELN